MIMKKLRARNRAAGPLERRLDPVIQVCRDSLAALVDSAEKPAKSIHQLRKNGKRLRGGLELLGAPEPVILELRDLGRMLAVARDSRVRVSTFETLCDRVGEDAKADADFEVAADQLRFEAQLGGVPPVAVRRFAGSRLEAVAQWLEGAEFGDAGEVARRMDRLISQAKQHLKVIAAKPDKLEDYHEGRKAVKALLGAAEFLFEDPDPDFRRELRRLDRLGEDLGWVQDLDVFDAWLNDHGLTLARMPVLHQVMQREIRKACRAARRRAGKCNPDLFRGKG
jgi:CHAD domain-containing protein